MAETRVPNSRLKDGLVTPRDLGAVSGTVDAAGLAKNTAAMVAAIAASGSGGTIWLGRGDWYFDEFDLPSQRHFIGEGRDETGFIFGGTNGAMITATGSIGGSSWRNMRIKSAALNTSVTAETFLYAYRGGSNRDLTFADVWIEYFSNNGLDLSDTYNLNCTNVRFNRNGNATTNGGAVALTETLFSSGSITSGRFENCHFGANYRTVYQTDPAQPARWISFPNCVWENNTNLPELGAARDIKFPNNYWEANTNKNTPEMFTIDGGANPDEVLPWIPTTGTHRIDYANFAAGGTNSYYELVASNNGLCGIRFGDTDATGRGMLFYDHNTDVMGFRVGGVARWRMTSTGLFRPDADDGVDIGDSSHRIRQVYTGAGTVSSMAIALNGTDTGLFNPGVDQVAVVAAGVTTATFRTDHSFWLNTTTNAVHSGTTPGFVVSGTTNGQTRIGVSGSAPLQVNRITNDGNVIEINQDGTTEGAISVAGTTVTYGSFTGSHWTQVDGAENLLRGTVLESVDAMAEWLALELPDGSTVENVPAGAKVGDILPYTYQSDDEEEGEITVDATVVLLANDQLPKAKVSDQAASPCVYGVVLSQDADEVTATSLGAYLVRIAKGVKVKRGDLLESNGDGCARVQSDDVVRSRTIGKVTAAIVRGTYDDGSYLVPCVLYCG